MTPRLLVIDDDQAVCDLLARVLARASYDVTVALTGEEGLLHVAPGALDCLIVDKHLPKMNGAEVVAEARRRIPGLPVVLMTAHPEPFSLGNERPDALLAKPFKSLAAIESAVVEALESAVANQSPLSELRERLLEVVTPIRTKRRL